MPNITSFSSKPHRGDRLHFYLRDTKRERLRAVLGLQCTGRLNVFQALELADAFQLFEQQRRIREAVVAIFFEHLQHDALE
jgi:hypothetical protein